MAGGSVRLGEGRARARARARVRRRARARGSVRARGRASLNRLQGIITGIMAPGNPLEQMPWWIQISRQGMLLQQLRENSRQGQTGLDRACK